MPCFSDEPHAARFEGIPHVLSQVSAYDASPYTLYFNRKMKCD